ncbi:sensor domain-containing diguanylate cyclase [Pseudomonas abietaniphila]
MNYNDDLNHFSDENPSSDGHLFLKPRVNRFAITFVIVAMLSVLSLGIAYLYGGYTNKFEEATKDNEHTAVALSEHIDSTVFQVENLSGDILERLAYDGDSPPALARLNKQFRKIAQDLPAIAGIFVFDSSGNVLVSDKVSPLSFNNSDRAYFRYHKAHPDDQGVHIGSAVESRTTGDLVIPISRRIEDSNGNFSGVFLATLKVDYLNNFYAQFLDSESSVVVLTLNDGEVLARAPYLATSVGKTLAQGQIFREYLPHRTSGTVMVTSVLEGIDKLFSYKVTNRYKLFIGIGITKTGLLAAWYGEALLASSAIALLLIILLLLGKVLVNYISLSSTYEEELEKAFAIAHTLSTEDALTGLKNRRYLNTSLPTEIGRAKRNNSPLGFIMMDIDYFKSYNDSYGHLLGDECLRAVSSAIYATIRRPGDCAVRYGGEELAVLLPDTDEAGTRKLATDLCFAVSQLGILIKAARWDG